MEMVKQRNGKWNTHWDDKFKKFISENTKRVMTGRSWFNNGIEEVFQYDCPDGFTYCRLVYKCTKKPGLQIVCITTGEYFSSVSEAARKYKLSKRLYSCKHNEYCLDGILNGEKLKWRMATQQEIEENER